jgi:hypothetical protein
LDEGVRLAPAHFSLGGRKFVSRPAWLRPSFGFLG